MGSPTFSASGGDLSDGSQECRGAGARSPAVTSQPSLLPAGGSGQVAKSVKLQGGL